MATIRFDYDPEADAASIYLKYPVLSGEAVRSDAGSVGVPMTSIVFSFDAEDHLIHIEILGASRVLPPSLL